MGYNRMLAGDPFSFTSREGEQEFAQMLHGAIENDWGGQRFVRNVKGRQLVFRLPQAQQLMDFLTIQTTGILCDDGDAEIQIKFLAPSSRTTNIEGGISSQYSQEFFYKYFVTLNKIEKSPKNRQGE